MHCRILVIDDNPAIHEDVKKILNISRRERTELGDLQQVILGTPQVPNAEQEVFDIDSAMSGKEGLELVQRAVAADNPYMLAFVDVRMPPGWDGIETIEHLWEVDRDLQVVICTAYSDHSWQDVVARLGRSDRLLVIKKPFDNIEILQAAHALTRKWLLHREVHQKLGDLESLVRVRTENLAHLNNKLKQEIDIRRKAEEQLKFMATHDALTSLPNRLLLGDRLSLALSRAQRHNALVAVMLLDLNDFKAINDVYGHDCGDALLKEVAGRLADTIRGMDTVGRLGGDEFLFVLEDTRTPAEVEVIAERIVAAFSTPFEVVDQTLHVTASIGISLFPTDFDTPENLLKGADIAMYQAKGGNGQSYRFCSSLNRRALDMGAGSQSQHVVRQALENGELQLYYQPLVDLSNGRLSGLEAFSRWHSPEHGLVDPMQFIPLAERSGDIIELGRWAVRTACQQCRAWQDQGLRPLPIAINLSARQFRAPDLIEMIDEALKSSRLDPSLLQVEITESTVMVDVADCRVRLAMLQSLGIHVIIDDFGSGYSSLNRLKTLSIHGLKIDRFFLHNIVNDERDAAIVMAIIALAHSLGIRVVVEGIESREQLEFMRNLRWDLPPNLNCDMGQGYFFARPRPADQATAFFERKDWGF